MKRVIPLGGVGVTAQSGIGIECRDRGSGSSLDFRLAEDGPTGVQINPNARDDFS